MTKCRLVQSGNTTAIPASTSRRTGLAGNCDIRIDTDTLNDRQIIHRTPGSLTQMEAHIVSNTTAANSTVTTQKAGIDQTLTVTIGGGAAGTFEDTTHSDAVAAADKWCFRTTTGAGGTLVISEFATTFEASDGTFSARVASGFDLFHSANTVQNWCGSIANDTGADANAQCRANFTGTWKNMALRIGANTHTTTSTYRNRINGANGTMVISVGSAATGDFEDTTHSDAVAVTDLINFNMDAGGGVNNIVPNYMASDITITDRRQPFVVSFDGGTAIASGVSTQGLCIGGKLVDLGTTSSFITIKYRGTAENLGCNIQTNTLNGNLTYTLFNNGGATSLVVTVGSGVTGQVNDTTHQVAIAIGDQLHTRPNTTAAGAGSATQKNVRLDIQQPAAGAQSGTVGVLII